MAYYILKSYKLKGLTADAIFRVFSLQKNCFFLDSSLNSDPHAGRFSFLGIDPFFILSKEKKNPFPVLRKLLRKYTIASPKTKIPFLGGAVGYLTYDLGVKLEKKITLGYEPSIKIPDSYFGFYNTVVAIDHYQRMLHVFSVGFPESHPRLQKVLAESNMKKIMGLLFQVEKDESFLVSLRAERSNPIKIACLPARQASSPPAAPRNDRLLKSNFTKENYLLAIKKAKNYIKKGDIYQVNLSQQMQYKTELSAADIYLRLRRISPSYFSAYFDAGDFQILSSSPERFLHLNGDIVTTTPMKGTRPRSVDRLKDKKLKDELMSSKKDAAELMMIVDLERNDLGRVCSYDSVKVTALRQLEEYSTVFQTTANIRGRLHRHKDRIDLLRACFPGGSITGCPKIRAMEIIKELEPTPRSVYTGCLGYLSFNGNMDFNILIRTILKRKQDLYFGAGGGIVADSDPEEEYKETLVKARAMIEAIRTPFQPKPSLSIGRQGCLRGDTPVD